jgi:carbon-monoxide dehydrogenase iron sulfur subunit
MFLLERDVKRIYAIEYVCIGCHLCEVYCQVEHSRSRNIIKTFKEEVPPPSRITVEEKGPLSFALQCRHCPEPYCAYACIAGAIYQDEQTGEVIQDIDKCIGCWTCVLSEKPPSVIFARAGKFPPVSRCAPTMHCI